MFSHFGNKNILMVALDFCADGGVNLFCFVSAVTLSCRGEGICAF
ncbi:hypothetical protein SCH4B_3713 [Ruegeria sp. TrichCH4B]|nr:hypothetical protein SCH4B_3713 [Ruegeria sp. TrichCH4B]